MSARVRERVEVHPRTNEASCTGVTVSGCLCVQDGWFPNSPIREILLRMTRKPRPHQFIGLMGKRSMGE